MVTAGVNILGSTKLPRQIFEMGRIVNRIVLVSAGSTLWRPTLGYQPWALVPVAFFLEAQKKAKKRPKPRLQHSGSVWRPLRPVPVRSSAGAQNPTVISSALFRHGLQSYQSLTSCLSNRCAKIVQPGVTGIFTKVFHWSKPVPHITDRWSCR